MNANRNFGVPSFEDVGAYVNTHQWPLHAQQIGVCDLRVVRTLAEGSPLAPDIDKAIEYLESDDWYRPVRRGEESESACHIGSTEVAQLIRDGFLEAVPEGEEMHGYVRLFTRAEGDRPEPRRRLLGWTYTVNQLHDKAGNTFELTSHRQVRQLLWAGEHAYSVDVKAAFNQFGIGPAVRNWYCCKTPLGWMRLCRMPMGCRPSCKVCQRTLEVVVTGARAQTAVYIDGVLGVGTPEVLIEDLLQLQRRSAQANLTFKEDLSQPESLVRQMVDFLGLTLDFQNKRVRAVPKLGVKLAVLWLRKDSWCVKDFIRCVAICYYHANATNACRGIGKWQYVLQRWARVQSEVVHSLETDNTDPYKRPFVIDQDLRGPLEDWVSHVIENPWIAVEKETDEQDFLMVTDGSKYGWCGILISCKCGKATVASGPWPEAVSHLTASSSTAEPLALLAAANHLLYQRCPLRVLHVGDNQGTVAMLNKGYSTNQHQHVCEALAKRFPLVTFKSEYYAGEAIPADEPSRGEALSTTKLETLCNHYGIRLQDIRDVSKQAPAKARPPE